MRRRRRAGSDYGSALPDENLTKAEEKLKRRILGMIRDGNIEGIREQARRGEKGLLCGECRRKAWPLLAGIDERTLRKVDSATVEEMEVSSHPETTQVDLDLNRSLFVIQNDDVREEHRAALRRMLLTALTHFGKYKGTTDNTRWYYQGLHDVAAVLLISLGETAGAGVLDVLLTWHLAPWMEGGCQSMKEVLTVIHPLLVHADPELGAVLQETLIEEGMGSDYALPWILTYMTHAYCGRLDLCCRLMDFCLSMPPITMVYVSVAAAVSRKSAVMEHNDSSMHYAMLVRLPSDPNLFGWLSRALLLYDAFPPRRLVYTTHGMRPPPVLHPDISPLFFLPSVAHLAGGADAAGVPDMLLEKAAAFQKATAEWREAVAAGKAGSSLVFHGDAADRSHRLSREQCRIALGFVLASMVAAGTFGQTGADGGVFAIEAVSLPSLYSMAASFLFS